MKFELDEILNPKTNEPNNKPLTFPVTLSDLKRIKDIKERATRCYGKNVVPGCMRKALRVMLDELEERLDQFEKESAG
jgi:hypothetical protein